MTTDDPITRAAEVMDKNFNPDRYPVMAAMFRDYAQAIDAAGLLATPAHDAEVAAKALREAGERLLAETVPGIWHEDTEAQRFTREVVESLAQALANAGHEATEGKTDA